MVMELAEIATNAEFTNAIEEMQLDVRMEDHETVTEWVDGDYLYVDAFADQVFPHTAEGIQVPLSDHLGLPTVGDVRLGIRETRHDFDDQIHRLIIAAARLCAQYCGQNFTGRDVTYTALISASGLLRCAPTVEPRPTSIVVKYKTLVSDPIDVPPDALILLWPHEGYTVTASWPVDLPHPDLEEPIIQMVAYLFDTPGSSTNARLAGAIINSGAGIHLNRYKRRWN